MVKHHWRLVSSKYFGVKYFILNAKLSFFLKSKDLIWILEIIYDKII